MSKRKYETTADNAQDTPVKKVPGGWKIEEPLELTAGLGVSASWDFAQFDASDPKVALHELMTT